MKLEELFEEEIRTAISITTANLDVIARKAFKGIPECLWENTTPRTEVASMMMVEPDTEQLKNMLDFINENVSKAFLKSAEEATRKFTK